MRFASLYELVRRVALLSNGLVIDLVHRWLVRAIGASRSQAIKIVHETYDLSCRRCLITTKQLGVGPVALWRKLMRHTEYLVGSAWDACELTWIDHDNDAVCIVSADCLALVLDIDEKVPKSEESEPSPIVLHATGPMDRASHKTARDPLYPRIVGEVAGFYLRNMSVFQRRRLNATLRDHPMEIKSLQGAHRAIAHVVKTQAEMMRRDEEAERHARELLEQEESTARDLERKRQQRKNRKRNKTERKRNGPPALDIAVDAALGDVLHSPSTNEGQAVGPDCVVCMDAPVEMVYMPCMHMCTCEECARGSAIQSPGICPLCREACREIRRVFFP